MSHSKNAAVASVFTYVQYGLSIVSGVLLFPLVIKSVGAYTYGIWLATGESISYVLLGDLGVFAVLPWLIASRLGANDIFALRQHMANSIVIGSVLGVLLLVVGLCLYAIDPVHLGVSRALWDSVIVPMEILLILYGVGYPFKAFQAFLVGVQDVYVVGALAVFQNVLLIALTFCVIFFSWGMVGLAVAAALPPFLNSLLAGVRVLTHHHVVLGGVRRPNVAGCQALFREGFGAWLGGLGFRLMAASNGIILANVGKPEWGTIFVSTAKISQICTPFCSTIPDSGLVGISHVHAENDEQKTRRFVVCLVLLYLLLPSLAAISILVANPAFVCWWISPELYAGTYVNVLLAATLIISGLAGGCVKLVSVVGHRQVVGWTTLVAGGIYIALGCTLVHVRGLVGLAEAGLLVWLCVILPVGFYLAAKVYSLRFADLLENGLARWVQLTIPMFILASWLGHQLSFQPVVAVAVSLIAVLAYTFSLRSLLQQAPWPAKVRGWLTRFSLVSA